MVCSSESESVSSGVSVIRSLVDLLLAETRRLTVTSVNDTLEQCVGVALLSVGSW